MKKLLLSFLNLVFTLSIGYSQSNYALIGASDVKMRSSASTTAEIVSLVQLGDVAKILEEGREFISVSGIEKPYKWFKLSVNGKTGWVFGAFVFKADNQLTTIQNTDMEEFLVGKFYNQTNDCSFMDCTESFMAVIPGSLSTAKKARMVNFSGKPNYRAMYSFGDWARVSSGFVKKNGNIALIIDKSSMIGGEYQVLELKWNGSSYTASELCRIAE